MSSRTHKQKRAQRGLSEAQFQLVFDAVRLDIHQLQLNNRVFSTVVDQIKTFPQLAVNFPGFFQATINAFHTDLVIGLGRIYDAERLSHASCTLARFVSGMRDNPQFFTDAAISARLTAEYKAANPHFLKHHRPDASQIDADLQTISAQREPLLKLRNKVYAHKDLDTLLSDSRDDFLRSHEEVVALIVLAHQIWNRHSTVWNAATWSENAIGEGDHETLFKYLRRGMKLQPALWERQTRRLFRPKAFRPSPQARP